MTIDVTAGSKFRFYWVVFTSGAIIMALEILSSRILAPYFGNSVYVWGSIISVFLAALALGYTWGGRMADRSPRLAVLGRLISLAALSLVILLWRGSRLAEALGNWTGNSPAGTLLATTLLFGAPSLFLATVSPYAVRLATQRLDALGATAGRLFALSTLGSLVGTLGCTFILVPHLTLQQSLSCVLFLTALTGGIAIVGEASRERLSLLLLVLLVGVAGQSYWSVPPQPRNILATQMTAYQTLEVVERQGVRYLRGDRVLQSAVRLDNRQPALPYLRYASAALLLNPEMHRVLVLGMGGGVVGTHLRQANPDMQIDYVEIDPAVHELAKRYLFFEDSPINRVHHSDGRQFLRNSEERWDFIFSDTYIGLSVPFHLTTVEFFAEVKNHLNERGVLGLNLAAGTADPFSRAVFRTLTSSFAQVHSFQVAGTRNVILLASDLPAFSSLIERGRRLDVQWTFDPTLTFIASRRKTSLVDLSDAMLLTDNFAPADHLIALGAPNLEFELPR